MLPEQTRHAPAFVEIDDRYAVRRAVDDVAADDGAFEGELGVDRRFAGARAGVAGDLQVARAVGADRRESAVRQRRCSATTTLSARKMLMPLPYWPVPPLSRRDALDAVAGHDRAVVAGLPAMDEDAAIGAVGDAVAGDREAAPPRSNRCRRRPPRRLSSARCGRRRARSAMPFLPLPTIWQLSMTACPTRRKSTMP